MNAPCLGDWPISANEKITRDAVGALFAHFARGHEMNIETHAPSQIILIVSLGISALALVCYVILAPSAAFWMALMANAIMVLGTLVKT